MYSQVEFTFAPHGVTLKSLNITTLQSDMETMQYNPRSIVLLPDSRIFLVSGLFDYNLNMSSTHFSTALSLEQSLPTKPASDLTVDKQLPDPILHFLDHPLETWQSTIVFMIILVCLILVTVFMGRRYMEALRTDCWSPRNNPLTLESLRQSHSMVKTGQDEHAASAVTGSNPFLDTDIRSRPCLHPGPTIISIGEVHNGKIAQRRRASSISTQRVQ